MECPIVIDKVTKIFRVHSEYKRKGIFDFEHLFKKREIVALDRLSLKIKKNEIFGLIGPNGAGKTTLTKIIATLQLPTSGNVFVNGYDTKKDELKIRDSIGLVLGEKSRALYWRLTGRENLSFFAKLYDIPKAEREKRIDELLELVGMAENADDYVMYYSTGMKNKINIARSLLNDAEILLFDEMTAGLDPDSAKHIRDLIKNLQKEHGKTIFLTSHNMQEIEQLCDRVAFLNRGKIIATDTIKNLKKKVRGAAKKEPTMDDVFMKILAQGKNG